MNGSIQPPGHGLILEPLVAEDYVFGGQSQLKGKIVNPEGDWSDNLPPTEFQAPVFETNACTLFGTTNGIETLSLFTFDEEINLSDRFAATGAGVNPNVGGTPKNAAEFLRKNWSVLESDWPMEGVMTVEEYYKPLPQHLFDRAKALKGNNLFGYEYVQPTTANLREALKRGPVGISVAFTFPDDNGLYYKPQGWRDTHWALLVHIFDNGDYLIFDSYAPFLKRFRRDFVSEFAYRYELNVEVMEEMFSLIQLIKKWIGI